MEAQRRIFMSLMEDHMDIVYGSCCGVDVHKKLIVACLRTGSRKKEIRNFGATTRELHEMAEWLKDNNCECVAMESTGSYWKPVYNVLEEMDLNPIVVNARHIKNIPGKKTDQQDADWICDLLRHGLLRASFIPDRRRRDIRELEAYLRSMKNERTAEANRLQKVFEGCNIKISGTISDVLGKSGMRLLDEYLKTGSITAERIAQMRNEGLISHLIKASNEDIARDFEGTVSDVSRILLLEIVSRIKDLDERIDRIQKALTQAQDDKEREASKAIQILPGIAEESSRIVVSVLGPSLQEFDSQKKLAAWAGVAPGNNESAGKRHSGRTTPGNKLLKSTLVQCAQAAVKKEDSFIYAKFNRLKPRLGYKKAIMAIAHTLLCLIWRILHDKMVYEDRGADYYDKRNVPKKINREIRKLAKLGVPAELLEPIKSQIPSA